jgi:uncharacterized membrane protein YeaQ/YmgE (transglycosylase-associated protein family)
MHAQLLWTVLGGLLIGALGGLAVRGHPQPLWPLSLLLGLGGALAGRALATLVLGTDHETVNLVVAVVVAALPVFCFTVYERTRGLSPR